MSLTQVKVLQGGTGASVRAIDNKFKEIFIEKLKTF